MHLIFQFFIWQPAKIINNILNYWIYLIFIMLNALISFDSWNLYNWFYIAAYLIDGMSCAFGLKGIGIIFPFDCMAKNHRQILNSLHNYIQILFLCSHFLLIHCFCNQIVRLEHLTASSQKAIWLWQRFWPCFNSMFRGWTSAGSHFGRQAENFGPLSPCRLAAHFANIWPNPI